MRSLLATTALLAVIGATPSMARDYPVCSRTATNDFNPSCSFDNFQQCQATVSGIGGDCFRNPSMAYNQAPQSRMSRKAMRTREQQENSWDNGWGSNRSW
jgi:hypothetical protein